MAAINRITERIIGCAIEVHRVLRSGLLESIYCSALALEFTLAGLSYVREMEVPTIYKGQMLGTFRVDFVVENSVVVEVKSVERMAPIFEAQLLTYLHLTGKRVGLLLNFNSPLMKDGITRRIL